jgi:hypothetical protein
MKMTFKPIVVVGNWKSGTTPLQYLITRDDNIHNIFPYKKYLHQDGTEYWLRHKKIFYPDQIKGEYISKRFDDYTTLRRIRKDLNMMHDKECEWGLLKRPSFSLQLNFINKLFDDAKVIGIKRSIYANIHSMLRVYRENGYDDDMYIGIHIPGWRKEYLPLIERLVLQYCYINNYLKKNNIFMVSYEEMCNDTKTVLSDISNYLGYSINIDIPKMINHESWKDGGRLNSLNPITYSGKLTIEKSEKIEFPPLNKKQINDIDKYYKIHKDVDVLDD